MLLPTPTLPLASSVGMRGREEENSFPSSPSILQPFQMMEYTDFQMLKQPCTLGINPTCLWYIVIFCINEIYVEVLHQYEIVRRFLFTHYICLVWASE